MFSFTWKYFKYQKRWYAIYLPENLEWICMDADDWWYGFELKPVIQPEVINMWSVSDGDISMPFILGTSNLFCVVHWTKSLRRLSSEKPKGKIARRLSTTMA